MARKIQIIRVDDPTYLRITVINKTKMTSVGKNMEKRKLSKMLVGIKMALLFHKTV
jgi:hypothetical protein